MRTLLLLPLAVLSLTGCAHAPMRFLDRHEELASLQLDPTTVVAREDGRRSRPGTDDYEWWYLDAVGKDGTVVVIVFSDNWLPGSHQRAVTVELTRPGQPTRRGILATDEPGSFAADRADVRIGHSRFEGDLERYTITVDPRDTQGLGCTLSLQRRAPSYRPGSGVMGDGQDFFAWLVAVPEGPFTGSCTVDGVSLALEGSGYHDHNWGNAPPWALMRNWWWGRGEVNGNTVVMAELRPQPGRGEKTLPLLYVAGPEGVVAELHGDAVRFTAGAPAPSEDPTNPELQPLEVQLEAPTGALKVRFARSGAPLTSADLLAFQPAFTRFLGRLAGKTPWYTRWRAGVSTERGGQAEAGTGTIEFMDFE